LLQQNPQIAAAQAAVDALAGAGTAASLLVPQSLPAPVAAPQGGSLPTAVAGAPKGSKVGDVTNKPPLVLAANAPGTEVAESAASATQGLQHAFTRAKAGKDSLQAATDTGMAANSGAQTATERAEPNKFLAAMEQAVKAPTSASALEPLLAPLVVKHEKGPTERNGLGGKSSDPTYAGAPTGVSAPDYAQPGAAAPVLAPEMQVAEQVRYWVSHNVQNAELSLDGLGQSPVQVSISLQGNEAQISFRTDEAAARDVLQNAGAHLKDMLQREGLVLTGVSVGNSGSGNADGSERRARPNIRQTAIAPLQVASVDSGSRQRTASVGAAGRSVDLFV
jgi:flagellar hook-length control protein FliK